MDEILNPRSDAPPARLWFAVLGAPVAWGAQGLIGWIVALGACGHQGDASPPWLSPDGLRGVEILISAVALVIAASALVIGIGAWRQSGNRIGAPVHAPAPYDFLASIAVLGSMVFLLGIVWATLPIFMLSVCEAVR